MKDVWMFDQVRHLCQMRSAIDMFRSIFFEFSNGEFGFSGGGVKMLKSAIATSIFSQSPQLVPEDEFFEFSHLCTRRPLPYKDPRVRESFVCTKEQS